MFFDQFDRIYIVNLRSRPDRKLDMQREMQALGLNDDSRVCYFDAIKCETEGPFQRIGSHGAFLSHLRILEKHADRGETILILQDDCEFTPGAMLATPSVDWDILYGGYEESDPDDLPGSDIIGAHCMAFRGSVIRRLVAFLNEVYDGTYRPPLVPDKAPAAPIDGAIVWFRRAHPDVRTKFQRVSYQRSSKTDIGRPSFLDNFPAVAALARRVLRLIKRRRVREAQNTSWSGLPRPGQEK